jgi:uncharacterized phage protein (TIGR01671 family)
MRMGVEMSRQLKFRAWDTVDKKWLFGYEYSSLGGFSLVGEVTLMGELNSVALDRWNDVAIMQFTGLTDKNGKEIYEGDIVKYQVVESTPRIAEVTYLTDTFCLKNDIAMPTRYYSGTGEVIGNIHENPELLK